MNQVKLGRFIRELRTELNMTQQELADKIEVSDKTISKWENGRGMPDISLLIPLSNALNVSVLELLNGERTKDLNRATIDLVKRNSKSLKIWKWLFMGIINVLLIFILLFIIYGYIIPKNYDKNNQDYAEIYSASMEPTFKVHDVVVYDKISIDSVNENDIVLFNHIDPDGNLLSDFRIIHRVNKITRDNNNNIKLVTKGDNNVYPDTSYVSNENFLGIYNHKISKLGSFFVRNNFKNDIKVLSFLILGILSILFLDILQFKKAYFNK